MLPSHWPKWYLIPISFLIVCGAIGTGLLLEPMGQALAPAKPTPVPTLAFIHYARPLSGECETCHFDPQALAASAESAEKAEMAYINPDSLNTPHGRLGCITCHGGTTGESGKEAAHQGLVQDLSVTHPQDCLLCHRNLPAEIPEDNLRTPHGQVVDAVWEGSSCGVNCSDCHGAVGHGFDPVTGAVTCSMNVCLDCHVERNLGAELTDCNACHTGPHDVALALSCSDCHTSTDTWKETALQVHPIRLDGYHAQVDCFDCHQWPNFRGLESVCSDCHTRTHDFGNDNCALCHTPEGWQASADALVAGAEPMPHPVEGREDCRACHGTGGQTLPADHKGRTNDVCQICHVPAPAPAVLHPAEGHESCLECHGSGQIAQFPIQTHRDYGEETCSICHEPSGLEPLPVAHPLEGRADCLMCHASQGIEPYPESHTGWGNELCLLCHEVGEAPTEGAHLFPQTHDGANKVCVLCHPENDFTVYHCDTCHTTGGMEQVHGAKGISNIEDRCVLCHPQGQKP